MKLSLLKKLGDRLHLLDSHDALVLLRYSFAIPKLLYCLRSAPCFASPVLHEYDEALRNIVSGITNCDLCMDDSAMIQATLPVRMGGLDIRSAVQLAPSAFLASTAASCKLVPLIIPIHLSDLSFLM